MSEPRVPPHLASSLVEALGAYLKATPAQELPPRFRPIRGFTNAALQRRKAVVLSLLDDASGRALILEWLRDGKPALDKTLAKKLELAARADEGWVERAAALDAGGTKAVKATVVAKPGPDERVAKLREELKQQRGHSREELGEERARSRVLASQVRSLETQLQEANRRLLASDAVAARDLAALQAASKRAKKDAERASAAAEVAREKLSVTKKELAAAKRRAADAERALARSSPMPGRKAVAGGGAPKGPRRPLKAPSGRLEDDPETLRAWLGHKGVHLFVDGYNVVLRTSPEADLAAKRERLIEDLQHLVRSTGVLVTVVFDGAQVPPGTRRRTGGSVRVEYSRPDEIADDHLIARLEELPPYPAVLVTNDRELRKRARVLGATVAGSDQLLALLGRPTR